MHWLLFLLIPIVLFVMVAGVGLLIKLDDYDAWWSFPLYCALALPFAIACIALIIALVLLGIGLT